MGAVEDRQRSDRPRMSVFHSLGSIYCQIIDDAQGRTVVSAVARQNCATACRA